MKQIRGIDEQAVRRLSSLVPLPLPLLVALSAIFLLIVPLFLWQRSINRELAGVREKAKELAALSAEYSPMKSRVDGLERRRSGLKATGVAQAVDDITGSIGLSAKVKSVKAMGRRELAGGIEESSEVVVEKVTTNELVNILYTIEDTPFMLSVRRLSVKKTFENPDLLNVNLTLSLFIGK